MILDLTCGNELLSAILILLLSGLALSMQLVFSRTQMRERTLHRGSALCLVGRLSSDLRFRYGPTAGFLVFGSFCSLLFLMWKSKEVRSALHTDIRKDEESADAVMTVR